MTSPGSAGAGRPVGAGHRYAVEAVDVVKRFGSTVALDHVGIGIADGQTHALVGRNGAGKSTLVAVLTGLQLPDSGQVRFDGAPAPPLSDRLAWRGRVACVYQHSTVIPTLSIAENVFLNRQQVGATGLVGWRAMRRAAAELLGEWGVDVPVGRPASSLSVEQRQFVEIARALSLGARFVILDEPTAQLDAAGIDRLFRRIRELQRRQVTFLFISHHLQEVFEICERVTVLRDARRVLTAPVADVGPAELVAAMTGEAQRSPATARSSTAVAPDAPVLLAVRELPTASGSVSFTLRQGESVGLAGGGGSGKVAVAEAVVGLRRAKPGSITVRGRPLRPGSVAAALRAGVGLVPQDRHRQGLVLSMSVAENTTMTVPHRLGPAGFIRPSRRDAIARDLVHRLGVKAQSLGQPVSGLSGGNQQKVVLGRALAAEPAVLVLITPTAGVDVRSKLNLLDAVEDVRRAGTAVLVVSDELDDLRGCDRVLVMFQGRITGELAAGWRDEELVAAMEGIGFDR